MPFNGAGVFSRTPGTRITNGGALVSAQVNDETDNLVDGINGKVNLDGLLPMTGLQLLFGDGTNVLHAATVKQVQKGTVKVAASVSGTVDAIVLVMAPTTAAWVTKETFEWVSPGANTIAGVTLDHGGGVKTVKDANGNALAVGATGASGVLNRGYYDGTYVRLLTPVSDLSAYATIASLLGQETIFVPALAMTPRTTNGPASGSVETTTNKVMLKTLDFDASTAEYAQFAVQMPKGWDLGTLICQFVWKHASTTTNFGVAWEIAAVAFANDDAGDTAFGTAVTVVDTGGTTNDIYLTGETGAMTVAGTPAAEEWVVFQINRAPANGSDTMAIDAGLLGVKIHYTTNALTDS